MEVVLISTKVRGKQPKLELRSSDILQFFLNDVRMIALCYFHEHYARHN